MFASAPAARRSTALLIAAVVAALQFAALPSISTLATASAQAPEATKPATTSTAAATTTPAATTTSTAAAPATTAPATTSAATTPTSAGPVVSAASTTPPPVAAPTPTVSPAGGPLIPPSSPPNTGASKDVAAEAKGGAKSTSVKRLSGGLKLLTLLGVFAVPLALANVFSKTLRMPERFWSFVAVLFAVTAGGAATYFGWPPKLGVDLRGGVNLVYELSKSQNDSSQPVDMDKMIGTINRRINPGGIKEVTVRPFGADKIEIIVPGADDDEMNRLVELIAKSGALEFRILANHHKYQNIIDAAEAQHRSEDLAKRPRATVVQGELPGGKGRGPIARWVSVHQSKVQNYRGSTKYATRDQRVGAREELQVLCVLDPYNVTGAFLTNASADIDTRGGFCVGFSFNSEGASRFSQLTGANVPVQKQTNDLGIILDGYLDSSPAIQSTISNRGEITGDFTEQQVKDLSELLTSGALPAALTPEPLSRQVTGPSLGDDTIKAGVNSMVVATCVVMVFMLFYYRFAGIVANIALILNVLLTVAFMVMFNAAFTLSGLAGLALTVGMAVDANVLIYERMREEFARGSTLRMAIRNGFDRASITIIDANVTTLITAIVLYIIGTDQVKGFAVSLTVGLVWNLFTAITVSRLIFDVAERNRWISNLRFMQFMGATNYDFIGKRAFCYGLSAALIGAGLVGTFIRGSSLLNIDFTGGVSITTIFEKPPARGIAEVREKIEKSLPEATVQQLGSIPSHPNGAGFKIITSDANKKHVEDQIKLLFGNELAFHRLSYGEIGAIAAATTPAAPADGPSLTPPATSPAVPPAGGDGPKPNQGSAVEGSGPTLDADDLATTSCDPKDEAKKDEPKKEEPKKDEPKKEDAKPAESKPADAKPAETKPAESKPAETKPAEAKPAETKPAEAKPAAPSTSAPTATPTATSAPVKNPLATLPLNGIEPEATVDPFAGGSLVTLEFKPAIAHQKLEEHVKAILQPDPDLPGTLFELSADGWEPGSSRAFEKWDLRVAEPTEKTKQTLAALEKRLVDAPFFPSSENIGAAVADSAKLSAAFAMTISLLLVMAYVWFRFQNVAFGFAAILALVHDVLFTIGCLALSYWLAPLLGFALVEPFKIDLTIVAALLTIIGYSINDTIVIFDRIREVRGKSPAMTAQLINTCVNQTLSRTILTSLTVFLVVLILYVWGGPGIHGFAFALVVGTISGTYSTIYVASPVLLWLHKQPNATAANRSAAATSA